MSTASLSPAALRNGITAMRNERLPVSMRSIFGHRPISITLGGEPHLRRWPCISAHLSLICYTDELVPRTAYASARP